MQEIAMSDFVEKARGLPRTREYNDDIGHYRLYGQHHMSVEYKTPKPHKRYFTITAAESQQMFDDQ